jgi:hypothetical protein
MPDAAPVGRLLLVLGVVLIVLGVLLSAVGRVPRLPGDILIRRDNVVFYFPVVTSLLVSLLLTIVLSLLLGRR